MGPSSSGVLRLAALLAAFLVVAAESDHKGPRKTFCYHSRTGNRTIYDYEIKDVHQQNPINWKQYKNQVVLVINVASFWGSTHQYFALNALQSSIRDFKILGVPCNQFGLQEPGDNGTEIMNGLKYVRPGGGFEPDFELTEKVEVNGQNEHPLYTFLKAYCPSPTQYFAPKDRLYYENLKSSDIRWNFEKFLIDRQGIPAMRFSETYPMEDIIPDIKQLLMAPEDFSRK